MEKNKNMRIRLKMCEKYCWYKAIERYTNADNNQKKYQTVLSVLRNHKSRIWAVLNGNYNYLGYVELVATTRCSLHCKDCANLMQYYEKPYDVDFETIKMAFSKLAATFDEIDTVGLIGGEPMLCKNLSELIDFVANFQNVNHVLIPTNGTLLPAAKDVGSLKNCKVKLNISNYGGVSRKKDELVEFLKKNNIRYAISEEEASWQNILAEDMKPKKRTSKELQKQFKRCRMPCRSMLNGKLFYCPRASHGNDLGYQDESRSYVDLLDDKAGLSEILNIVYSSRFFAACDYCNYGTKELVAVPAGKQMKKNEHAE